MDRSFVAENRVERDRIRALVAQLTDADMARELDHMAFWDRMWLQKLAAWERSGTVCGRLGDPPFRVDTLNAALLPWCLLWKAMKSGTTSWRLPTPSIARSSRSPRSNARSSARDGE